MHQRLLMAALAALLLIGTTAAATSAAQGGDESLMGTSNGARVIVRSGTSLSPIRPILRPTSIAARNGAAAVAGADIQVTYTGFSQEAMDAFEAAVAVWESAIVSPRIIHVAARWTPLATGVLGSSGPNAFYRRSTDDHWYPAALMEAICNCEGLVVTELGVDINSTRSDWYLGTDGSAPSNTYDLYTVVLHELAHGLGFISSFGIDGLGRGAWGFSDGINVYPLGFDMNEWSASSGGYSLTNTSAYPNPSVALKTELTDGSVYFGGANVVAVNGGRAKFYAPNPWAQGSSSSHFDENTFPAGNENALMTPFVSNGEVNHDPGPLTLAVFRDIGWPTPSTGPVNDNFANAQVLAGSSGSVAGSNVSATGESGEPVNTATSSPIQSIWFTWVAPADGSAVVDLCGSDLDTTLGIYSGSAVNSLAAIANNDDDPTDVCGLDSTVSFPVSSGSTYRISVDGYEDAQGAIVLNYSLTSGDNTPPVVQAPSRALFGPQTLGTTAALRLSWPPASDPSGIASYELQSKKGAGAWKSVNLLTPTSTSVDVSVLPGTKYTFRLRATDGASNTGAWATTTGAKTSLLQETATNISYAGDFKRVALAGASGAYVRKASVTGRIATLTFTGRSVAFVTTLAKARGIVEIRSDGGSWATIDLYAPTTQTKRIVWAASFAPGTHTVDVRVTGSRNPIATDTRIDIDAFLVQP